MENKKDMDQPSMNAQAAEAPRRRKRRGRALKQGAARLPGRPRMVPTNPVMYAVRNIGTGGAPDAAKLIGIHKNTLFRLMKKGNLDGSPHWLVVKISKLSGIRLSILAPATYKPDDNY